MVLAAVFTGALDAHHVLRLFDHADHPVVASRVGAYRARTDLAHVSADVAEPYFFLDFRDGVDQLARLLVGGRQQIEGDALRPFGPMPGSPANASMSRCIAPSYAKAIGVLTPNHVC